MRWLAEALTHTKLGLRIGPRPHFVISTTPKPRPEVRKLVADPRVLITKGSTRDAHHLDPTVRAALMEEYDGTRTGRQELDAEILDDVEGALWTQAVIDRQRLPGPAWKSATEFDGQALYSLIQEWQDTTPWPLHLDEDCPCQGVVGETCLPGTSLLPFAPGHECPAAWVPITAIQRRRPWVLVETVDPPGETAECGITIVASPKGAVSGVDHCVVLADLSVAGPPETWGQRVVDGWKAWQVPKVRVEKNQGQDMTRATIHAVDRACPVDKLTAVGSKGERANPVATLYWRGWVHHLGTFVKLEDQLATWVEGESPSPDRLDALVHGVTDRLPDRAARTGRTHSPNDRRLPSRGTGVGGATATFR